MGQCQSRDSVLGFRQGATSSSSSLKKTLVSWDSKLKSFSRGRAASRKSENSLDSYRPTSPSERTEETHNESPTSVASPSGPGSKELDNPVTDSISPDLLLDDDEGETKSIGLSFMSLLTSLKHGEDLQSVIPEEVDPDAPSDEEEHHQTILTPRLSRKKNWEEEPGPLNPLGTKMDRSLRTNSPKRHKKRSFRLRHRKGTQPGSVVHHDPPLIAPPPGQAAPLHEGPPSPGSVDPHTIAQFNKLRVQAKLAAHQERKKRYLEKLEDRYQDVKEYRGLWKEFEQIKDTVASSTSSSPTKHRRHRSFDLKNSKSWYFDFQSIDDADDDDQNQKRLSLLRQRDMETQKLIFEEKSLRRLRRSNSEPCLSLLSRIETPTKAEAVADASRDTQTTPRRKSFGKIRQILSTPQLLPHQSSGKGEANEAREKPSDGRDSSKIDELEAPKTPERKELANTAEADYIARVAATMHVFNYAAEENDYGVKKHLADEVDENSLTPKASSRRRQADSDDISETSQLYYDDNDYHVPRRRRQPSRDLSEISGVLSDAERRDAEILGLELPPSPERPMEYVIKGIQPGSSGIAFLKLPSFESEDSGRSTPVWRSFSEIKERVVTENAARCLDDVLAACDTPEDTEEKLMTSTKLVHTDISNMSTEEFLRISDEHALVRVTRMQETDSTSNAGPDMDDVPSHELDSREVIGNGECGPNRSGDQDAQMDLIDCSGQVKEFDSDDCVQSHQRNGGKHLEKGMTNRIDDKGQSDSEYTDGSEQAACGLDYEEGIAFDKLARESQPEGSQVIIPSERDEDAEMAVSLWEKGDALGDSHLSTQVKNDASVGRDALGQQPSKEEHEADLIAGEVKALLWKFRGDHSDSEDPSSFESELPVNESTYKLLMDDSAHQHSGGGNMASIITRQMDDVLLKFRCESDVVNAPEDETAANSSPEVKRQPTGGLALDAPLDELTSLMR